MQQREIRSAESHRKYRMSAQKSNLQNYWEQTKVADKKNKRKAIKRILKNSFNFNI
jgi:hypothetical protein